MSFADYASYDGLGLAELVRKRAVSPSELLDAAVERIERRNGALNAVVYKAYDEAREAARGPLSDGPFTGVPFLIKDLGVRVKDWPRTSGSRFACVEADESDSELIRRYRASGVVLAGKTNTPEFGIPGVTTRPGSVLAAIRGIPNTFQAAHPAAPPLLSPAAWSRSRMQATAWVQSGFRQHAAGWLG